MTHEVTELGSFLLEASIVGNDGSYVWGKIFRDDAYSAVEGRTFQGYGGPDLSLFELRNSIECSAQVETSDVLFGNCGLSSDKVEDVGLAGVVQFYRNI